MDETPETAPATTPAPTGLPEKGPEETPLGVPKDSDGADAMPGIADGDEPPSGG